MKNAKEKKSAYVGYSEEEVRRMEGAYFCLHLGGDFVSEDGAFLFTKDEAYRAYKRVFKDLAGVVSDGTPKDRAYALDLIGGLLVKPMRLH